MQPKQRRWFSAGRMACPTCSPYADNDFAKMRSWGHVPVRHHKSSAGRITSHMFQWWAETLLTHATLRWLSKKCIACRPIIDHEYGRVPRDIRACTADSLLAGRDPTAWLGWEDSNSEMSSQNIPLKGRTDFRDPAEFRPQRLFAFELRRWEAQLENSIKRHRYTPWDLRGDVRYQDLTKSSRLALTHWYRPWIFCRNNRMPLRSFPCESLARQLARRSARLDE